MSIQSNINQLLAMGGVFTQLPAGQKLRENLWWKRNWEKYKKTEKGFGVDYTNPQVNEQNAPAYEQAIVAREHLLAKGESQLAERPTKQAMSGQIKVRSQTARMRDAYEAYLNKQGVDGTPGTGNQHMQTNGQKQVIQMENFNQLKASLSPEERREALEIAGRRFK